MMISRITYRWNREMGTLEQSMVTPISTPALILGKTIPLAIIGFIEISITLAFGILRGPHWMRCIRT